MPSENNTAFPHSWTCTNLLTLVAPKFIRAPLINTLACTKMGWCTCRKALGQPLDLYDIRKFDAALGATLEKLYAAYKAHQAQGGSRRGPLLVDGCPIEDLCLTFVLPGYPEYELKKNGGDITVDASNAGAYISAVVEANLESGIKPQMDSFRSVLLSRFVFLVMLCAAPAVLCCAQTTAVRSVLRHTFCPTTLSSCLSTCAATWFSHCFAFLMLARCLFPASHAADVLSCCALRTALHCVSSQNWSCALVMHTNDCGIARLWRHTVQHQLGCVSCTECQPLLEETVLQAEILHAACLEVADFDMLLVCSAHSALRHSGGTPLNPAAIHSVLMTNIIPSMSVPGFSTQ